MKTMNLLLVGCSLAMLLACGGTNQEAPREKEQWVIDKENSVLEWTAYKTNDKIPVGGTFNTYELNGKAADSMEELLRSLTIEIETASVETKDEGRNEKIASFFFGTIGTEKIDGRVLKLKKDCSAEIGISINGIEAVIPVTYTLKDDWFSFRTTVDVSLWNALSGIEKLNEVCYDLHKGKDGVSKLWTEVELSFKTRLIRVKSE